MDPSEVQDDTKERMQAVCAIAYRRSVFSFIEGFKYFHSFSLYMLGRIGSSSLLKDANLKNRLPFMSGDEET
jgi:hypothetical protein